MVIYQTFLFLGLLKGDVGMSEPRCSHKVSSFGGTTGFICSSSDAHNGQKISMKVVPNDDETADCPICGKKMIVKN
jgi:DNA-directed RNA polymerase subunit RPC12/RpoP